VRCGGGHDHVILRRARVEMEPGAFSPGRRQKSNLYQWDPPESAKMRPRHFLQVPRRRVLYILQPSIPLHVDFSRDVYSPNKSRYFEPRGLARLCR
jgi:hypothetical protein